MKNIWLVLSLYGSYNLDNMLAAASIGTHFKIPGDVIAKALSAYTPENKRSQVIKKDGNTIILDAYNANPTSMQAALSDFFKLKSDKKIVFLGDMLELGKESEKEHQDIVSLLQRETINFVILVGLEFGKTSHSFLHFEKTSEAREWLNKQNFQDACFLIKGSRGIKLETLLT